MGSDTDLNGVKLHFTEYADGAGGGATGALSSYSKDPRHKDIMKDSKRRPRHILAVLEDCGST